MRITVSDVLDYLASGMTEQDIISDFPELTREDIRACLAFAADRERRLSIAVDMKLPLLPDIWSSAGEPASVTSASPYPAYPVYAV
jgi:hypothetical protein